MNNQVIVAIYEPMENDDWFLIETNNLLYSMRLGGMEVEDYDVIASGQYRKLEIGEYIGKQIQSVLTDGEWVYVLLEAGLVISSGWVGMSREGEPDLGIRLNKIKDYDDGFFASLDWTVVTLGS